MAKGKGKAAAADASTNGASNSFGVTADALSELSEVREAPRGGT